MKSAELLKKLTTGAQEDKWRLIYFDEAGFAASPPIQYGWSPIGKPHVAEPKPHCRRSVLGALDYGANRLDYQIECKPVTRDTVVDFLQQIAEQNSSKLTFVILDNAQIHHHFAKELTDRWLFEHHMLLLYLPAYSPELNKIEMVWKQAKYHWRRFVTWTKETMEQELDSLLAGYGEKYEICFS